LSRGEVLRYDVVDKRSILGTSDETTQSVQSKTDSRKVWKVTDVFPEGDIEFINLVERVHMINRLPDNKGTEYDSERDKVPPPGFEDTARSIGAPLSSLRMTDRGKTVSRKPLLRGKNVDEDAPIALRLPDEPVAIGDTWDEPFEVKVSLPQGASKLVKTRWHHKLADVKDGVATIEVTYQVLTPIDAQVELQVVQRLMSGKVQFDIERGRILSRQMGVDKRILDFAGPTSSVEYVMKMEEKLVENHPETAATKTRTNTAAAVDAHHPTTKTRTANRAHSQQSSKTYRR
ncbi:MAG TPA: hypothetical protein VFW73_06685, partial [Lacipirellulaceae bacterium]|nr:hypothetical protein [Lacipirellulaceae bacterium]